MLRTVKKVVRQERPTIKTEAETPDYPVICGTRMKSRTPRMFCKTGKNTPNAMPCFALDSMAFPISKISSFIKI